MSLTSSEDNIRQIEQFARKSLSAFDLDTKGWSFRWDRAIRRFGCCDYTHKRITISKHLVRLNSLEQSKDTVLHEIAHALAGKEAGHGPAWVAACRMVGARPERCYSAHEVQTPQSKYIRYCPSCYTTRPLHRKSNKKYACGKCCAKYNNGHYTPKFELKVVKREDFVVQSSKLSHDVKSRT